MALAREEQVGGPAGDSDCFQGVALVQPIETVPEPDAPAEHDRDQHDVQVVDQVSLQELVDRGGPAAEPYVQVADRLALANPASDTTRLCTRSLDKLTSAS